jgi:hypothetical protein
MNNHAIENSFLSVYKRILMLRKHKNKLKKKRSKIAISRVLYQKTTSNLEKR